MPGGNRPLLVVTLVVVGALIGSLLMAVRSDGGSEARLATDGGRHGRSGEDGGDSGDDGDREREDHDEDGDHDDRDDDRDGDREGGAGADHDGATSTSAGSTGPGATAPPNPGAGGAGEGSGAGAPPTDPGGTPNATAPQGVCTYGPPLSQSTTVSTGGAPAVDRRGVGLIVGHSNGVRVGNQFVALAAGASRFPWVNAAKENIDAAEWSRRARWVAGGPVDQALGAAGWQRSDVQVVLLAALSTRAVQPDSPAITAEWSEDLLGILAAIEQELPSVRAVYVTGPISHAYKPTGSANAEPSAFRHGQGVLDALARYQGPLTVVYGPYLWNDPTCPRADGLRLAAEHMEDDIHPNESGSRYLATYMVDYFRNHPSSRGWW